MAKVNKDGTVRTVVFFHEEAYGELCDAKENARIRAKEQSPETVGKIYPWGRFFLEVYRFAIEKGFGNE